MDQRDVSHPVNSQEGTSGAAPAEIRDYPVVGFGATDSKAVVVFDIDPVRPLQLLVQPRLRHQVDRLPFQDCVSNPQGFQEDCHVIHGGDATGSARSVLCAQLEIDGFGSFPRQLCVCIEGILWRDGIQLAVIQKECGVVHAQWLEDILFHVVLEILVGDDFDECCEDIVAEAVFPALSWVEEQRVLRQVFHAFAGLAASVGFVSCRFKVRCVQVVGESRRHRKEVFDRDLGTCLAYCSIGIADIHRGEFRHVVFQFVIQLVQFFFQQLQRSCAGDHFRAGVDIDSFVSLDRLRFFRVKKAIHFLVFADSVSCDGAIVPGDSHRDESVEKLGQSAIHR